MTKQSQIFQSIIRPKRTLEPLGGPISGFFSAAGFCARRERRIGSFSRQSRGTNFISFNLVRNSRARRRAVRGRFGNSKEKSNPTARVSSVSHAPQQLRPRRERWSRFYGSSSAWSAQKNATTRFKLFPSVASLSQCARRVVAVGPVVGSVVRSSYPSNAGRESPRSFELPLDFLSNDSSIDPPSKPPIDRSRPTIRSIR